MHVGDVSVWQQGDFPQMCVSTELGDDLISAASSNPFDFLMQNLFFVCVCVRAHPCVDRCLSFISAFRVTRLSQRQP